MTHDKQTDILVTVQDILAVVQDILRDITGNAGIVLSLHSTANDVDEWDSLAHIGLINALESAYRIRFALGELDDIHNVGQLVDSIVHKLQRAG